MVKGGQGWSMVVKDCQSRLWIVKECFKYSLNKIQAFLRQALSMLQEGFKLFQLPSPDEGLIFLYHTRLFLYCPPKNETGFLHNSSCNTKPITADLFIIKNHVNTEILNKKTFLSD